MYNVPVLSSLHSLQRNADQHRVAIVSTCTLCAFFLVLHRRHCNVDRKQVNIVSTSFHLYPVYIVNIVDIEMLTNIE